MHAYQQRHACYSMVRTTTNTTKATNKAQTGLRFLFFFCCDHQWTSPAGGHLLHAEPRGVEDSDGCVRCYGTKRQTVAMALAESQHHSAQRPKMARAGAWGSEHCAATSRKTHSPPGDLQPVVRRRARRFPGRLVWVSRGGHRQGFCGTSWSTWLTSVPSYWFSTLLCRRWRTSCWKSSGTWTLRCQSRLSNVPNISFTLQHSTAFGGP